jgi:hypothetical protein
MAVTHGASSIEGRTGLLVRISSRLHGLYCGLIGHEMILKLEPQRISLQCVFCPHESPGWNLGSEEAANGIRVDGRTYRGSGPRCWFGGSSLLTIRR